MLGSAASPPGAGGLGARTGAWRLYLTQPPSEAQSPTHPARSAACVTINSMACGCGSVVKLLADYLEQQLPDQLRAELDDHLRRCPRCVAQLRSYESTVSMLRSLREEDLPPELRLSVKSFINAKCHNN